MASVPRDDGRLINFRRFSRQIFSGLTANGRELGRHRQHGVQDGAGTPGGHCWKHVRADAAAVSVSLPDRRGHRGLELGQMVQQREMTTAKRSQARLHAMLRFTVQLDTERKLPCNSCSSELPFMSNRVVKFCGHFVSVRTS